MGALVRLGLILGALALAWAQAGAGAPPAAHAAFPGLGGGSARVAAQSTLPPSGRILFTKAAGQFYQTFSIDGDGSNLQQLTNEPTTTSAPTWSPDGERIAYFGYVDQSDVTTFSIFAVSVSGGPRAQLTEDEDGVADIHPHWSPRGDEIAYTATVVVEDPVTGNTSPRYDAHVINSDGSGDRTLGQGALPLAWSPSGSQIAYRNQADDTLWVMGSDGSGKHQVSGTDVGICDWSPNGETLACHNVAFPKVIKLISATTGDVTVIKGDAHSPVWSPDGKEIAFTVYDSGRISVMDRDGSNVRDLVEGMGPYDWVGPGLITAEFTQGIQELQSTLELQESLASGDGQPPVRLVAGKPMAMRVYFDKVDQPVTYTVDTNVAEDVFNETVQLTPDCDIEKRRKLEDNCQSVDFWVEPPEGEWTAEVIVKDQAGEVVEEHEFHFNTPKAKPLVLAVQRICHLLRSDGSWACGDPSEVPALLPLLKNLAPTHDVRAVQPFDIVFRDSGPMTDAQWWDGILDDIEMEMGANPAPYVVPGEVRVGYGAIDPAMAGLLGRALLGGFVAAAQTQTTTMDTDDSQATLAHEVGHALGLQHTTTDQPRSSTYPGCWGLPENGLWDYADNMLRSGLPPGQIEVGFDVRFRSPKPGDEYFELMGYCNPQWISPYKYNALFNFLVDSPPAPARAPQALAGGDFWTVAGRISGGTAELRPLFQLATEGETGEGTGSDRIEVRGAGNTVLFTRRFDPVAADVKPEPGTEPFEAVPSFVEMVPVQPGATAIVILDGSGAELGRTTLGGAAPTVAISLPGVFSKTQTLAWAINDADGGGHSSWVQYSADGGVTWHTLAVNLEATSLSVDFEALQGSPSARFRVLASDGANTGVGVSAPFTVIKKLPRAEIVSPQGGSFRLHQLVWLQAAAMDVDDGFLDDGAVTWSSSRDGNLGTGASLPVYDLSLGTHTITMTARDSDDNEVKDTITVTVFDAPIVEGVTGLSGDVDCSGAVDSIDALKLSRHVSGLPVSQTQPCQPIGTANGEVFGDVNCDDNITAVDSLLVLRSVSLLPVNLPQGCRPIGT